MAIYCCFTRTTLFTTMFTVVIVVCSLKSMCIPLCEDGFRIECLLPRKPGFSECMGAMLANLCHPYIRRGYRPFVIPWHYILYHGIIYLYHGIIYYTMALYTIPWHYLLYHGIIYYTMALYTIPWHYLLYHGIIYYTMAIFTIPWHYLLYHGIIYL